MICVHYTEVSATSQQHWVKLRCPDVPVTQVSVTECTEHRPYTVSSQVGVATCLSYKQELPILVTLGVSG